MHRFCKMSPPVRLIDGGGLYISLFLLRKAKNRTKILQQINYAMSVRI